MKLSIAVLCLSLALCSHAATLPPEVSTPGLPPIEAVPDETTVVVLDDTTTPAEVHVPVDTTPAVVVADDSTTPAEVHVTTETVTITTTTATTAPPSRPNVCYECESGNHISGWTNPNCPVNGNINSATVTVRTCSVPCVTIVGLYPPGTATRACGDNYWFPENFDLSDGCRTRDNAEWCFCRGDRCNNQNKTAISESYIQQYKKMNNL